MGDTQMAKELQEFGQWKVGMEVFVHGKNSSIAKITKITEAWGGTVFVDTLKFDVSGSQRTNDAWNSLSIVPLTPAIRDNFQRDIRQRKLLQFNFKALTSDQVDEIVFFMREKGIKI